MNLIEKQLKFEIFSKKDLQYIWVYGIIIMSVSDIQNLAYPNLFLISGVNYISVIGIIAETGDLRNYEHAKQVIKMSGLSLKENSSGKKKERNIFPKEAVLN